MDDEQHGAGLTVAGCLDVRSGRMAACRALSSCWKTLRITSIPLTDNGSRARKTAFIRSADEKIASEVGSPWARSSCRAKRINAVDSGE